MNGHPQRQEHPRATLEEAGIPEPPARVYVRDRNGDLWVQRGDWERITTATEHCAWPVLAEMHGPLTVVNL